MYIIVTRKRGGQWHPYGARIFNNKKDAVAASQIGVSVYADNIFSIVFIGDAIDWETKAFGQSIK